MGLLDTALGMLSGSQDPNQPGDPKMMLMQAAIGMLSNSQNGGGVQGMVATFQQSGLGEIVSSWVGTGQNLPISADQIKQALGNGQLQQLADAAGISHDSAAGHLAEMLPGVINHLTPDGEVPEEGSGNVGDLLQSFATSFFGNRAAT
ncbi:YidB family protein [Undibacterium sp. TJN25]|uniref:YidB family protein n=1 Tax=Undibacterium sp. TJN25 TaxID=3413056 RepID=UPI003BF15EE3